MRFLLRYCIVIAVLADVGTLIHIHPGWFWLLGFLGLVAKYTHHMMFHTRRVL